jgi:hypothetical protein
MRMVARHLGIGQSVSTETVQSLAPTAPASTITPIYALSPGLPNNYGGTVATGVIPGNEIGQTNPNLAGNSADLCAEDGGTWNATTNTCNMCPQNAFAALFMPETWDATNGVCDTSYTPLVIAGGGLAVLVLLIAMLSKR